LIILGFPDDSLELLEQGEHLARGLGDQRILASLYSYLSMHHTYKGDSSQGIKYSENSLEEAEKIKDIDLMSQAVFPLCASFSIWST